MSRPAAYYNENDPFAAALLRALVADGTIAPGDVDDRSIADVQPDDLRGYAQCHWFAGGGLWSVAARFAGWPDDRPLWTASCPCQPWSIAGKGDGEADPRHLWPHVLRLAGAARPPVIVGEQVTGAAGLRWFDGVCASLEGERYACRAVDIPACAVDAPHERSRLYWCAVANPHGIALDGGEPAEVRSAQRSPDRAWYSPLWGEPADAHGDLDVVDGHGERREEQRGTLAVRAAHARAQRPARRNGSWWAGAELVDCYDGKRRRAEPDIPFLVDGFSGRVGLWSVAGNAIVAPLAAEVLGALLDVLPD